MTRPKRSHRWTSDAAPWVPSSRCCHAAARSRHHGAAVGALIPITSMRPRPRSLRQVRCASLPQFLLSAPSPVKVRRREARVTRHHRAPARSSECDRIAPTTGDAFYAPRDGGHRHHNARDSSRSPGVAGGGPNAGGGPARSRSCSQSGSYSSQPSHGSVSASWAHRKSNPARSANCRSTSRSPIWR